MELRRLVLSRRPGEKIFIGDDIILTALYPIKSKSRLALTSDNFFMVNEKNFVKQWMAELYEGECLFINDCIIQTILNRIQTRIVIDAPINISVDRKEIRERKLGYNDYIHS